MPGGVTNPAAGCLHGHRPLWESHDHQDGHGQDHQHGHRHDHKIVPHRPRQRRALLICLVLTTITTGVEVAAGWITGSLMLLSDAIHMLSHSAALGTSYIAILIAARKADDRFSFGLFRTEVLGALLNGMALAGCMTPGGSWDRR